MLKMDNIVSFLCCKKMVTKALSFVFFDYLIFIGRNMRKTGFRCIFLHKSIVAILNKKYSDYAFIFIITSVRWLQRRLPQLLLR